MAFVLHRGQNITGSSLLKLACWSISWVSVEDFLSLTQILMFTLCSIVKSQIWGGLTLARRLFHCYTVGIYIGKCYFGKFDLVNSGMKYYEIFGNL